MNRRHIRRPIRGHIELELLLFKGCIRSVERAERRGTLSKEDAHRLRNGLASVYAGRIETVVNERRP